MGRNPASSDERQLPAEEAIPDGLAGSWWVAHTRPRSEKALAADLAALGIAHYLPLQRRETKSRRTGRTSRSVLPLFSGYVFFNGTQEDRYRALKTKRIANTLAVPEQHRLVWELRQIHKALASGVGLQRHARLQVGSPVRVAAGPLTGIEGLVFRRLSRVRLVLNVKMLGQSVSLQVAGELLEPISDP